MKINKFAFKLSALAVAAMSSAGAFATGTISAPATSVVYAMEDIYATPITLPAVTYLMGVGRGTTGQDMTIIYTLPTGTSFATVPTSLLYVGSSTTVTSTIKRGGVGASQVVYSVSIGATATVPSDAFTLGATTSVNAGLLTASSTLPITVKLLDQVETACVDNAGSPIEGAGNECLKSVTYGTLARAADFYNSIAGAVGVATDLGTTTDVLANVPLAGFVAPGTGTTADTITTANATVRVKTTTAGVKNSVNSGDYTLVAGDLVTLTITDPTNFLGLAASGLKFDGQTFAVSGNTATLADIPGTNASLGSDKLVTYLSDGTTPMGTSRTLSIAGDVNALDGIDHIFTGNSTWWQWNSNGIVLETPMSAVTSGYNNRFVFMNYGTSDATMTAQCLVEAGKTGTSLLTGSGVTLPFGKQKVVLASEVCNVTGTATGSGNAAARAGVRFTINAPTNTVKGVYNSVNNNTGAVDSIELLPIRTAPRRSIQ